MPVLNDTAWEADAERFAFNATNPANGQTASAPGTILDDEAHPPVVSVGSVTDHGRARPRKQVCVPVTLDKPLRRRDPRPVVHRGRDRTAPSDYTAQANQQVVFEAGQVSRLIKISVTGDRINEAQRDLQGQPVQPVRGRARHRDRHGHDPQRRRTDRRRRRCMSVNDVRVDRRRLRHRRRSTRRSSLNIKAPAKITATISTVGSAPPPRAWTTPAYTHKVDDPQGRGRRPLHDQGQERSHRRDRRGASTSSISGIVGATPGKTVGTVTIVDNDNPLPTTPTGIAAVKSAMQLGGTEVSWNAATTPLADWPLTGYEYRVSTNGGATWGAWTRPAPARAPGSSTRAGRASACTYQVRGVNKKGPGGSAGQATAVGLADTTSPGDGDLHADPARQPRHAERHDAQR